MILGEQCTGLAKAFGNHIEYGAANIVWHLLGQPSHLQSLLAQHFAAIGLQLVVEQLHQRRLAGAVASDQTKPLARLDLQIDPVEQRRAAKGECHVSQRQ